MYDQDRNRFAPVKVGDEIDVKIEAVGEKGDGIAKQEGFVLFVPNTKEGQEVKIRIIISTILKIILSRCSGQYSSSRQGRLNLSVAKMHTM